jgi:hypothetical protein
MTEYAKRFGAQLGVTPKDVEEAKFPTPGRMTDSEYKNRDGAKRALKEIREKHYGPLSSDTHLGWLGMMNRSFPLLETNDDTREIVLDQLRDNYSAMNIAYLIAIISEVQAKLAFDFADRLHYLWQQIATIAPPAKELYDFRYRDLI